MGKTDPGKRFEQWLKDSMESVGMYVMRIPDKVIWTGRQMVGEETPADFSAYYAESHDGEIHCLLVEAKACSQHRIPFDRLKPHQVDALRKFDDMHENMHGIVALNFYDSANIRRLNVCFFVPIGVWLEYRDKPGAMKSLSHEECSGDERITLCQRSGALFDMSRLIRRLR